MTSRERLVAAARGGETDQKPVISWSTESNPDSDAIITKDAANLAELVVGEKAVLFEISNPFGLAQQNRVDLNKLHSEDPEAGATKLEEYKQEILARGHAAIEAGADGIFYVLNGARGAYSSPMQYGGFYLECDREILSAFEEATLNVLYVVGNDDVYIDFVSDLPAHLFAWDAAASTFDSNYVRTLRKGAQASSDPESEVRLVTSVPSVADALEKEAYHAV